MTQPPWGTQPTLTGPGVALHGRPAPECITLWHVGAIAQEGSRSYRVIQGRASSLIEGKRWSRGEESRDVSTNLDSSELQGQSRMPQVQHRRASEFLDKHVHPKC